MTIWIVGKVVKHTKGRTGPEWEFCGAFSTEEKAVRVCRGPGYFVGKAELDFVVPEESVSWPGAYYPHGNIPPERSSS